MESMRLHESHGGDDNDGLTGCKSDHNSMKVRDRSASFSASFRDGVNKLGFWSCSFAWPRFLSASLEHHRQELKKTR